MGVAFPELDEATRVEEEAEAALPWKVVVSNDPVNLFSVVTLVLQRVLALTEEVALLYTNKIHYEGRCVVFQGAEEACREKAEILMGYNLWTHVEKG